MHDEKHMKSVCNKMPCAQIEDSFTDGQLYSFKSMQKDPRRGGEARVDEDTNGNKTRSDSRENKNGNIHDLSDGFDKQPVCTQG